MMVYFDMLWHAHTEWICDTFDCAQFLADVFALPCEMQGMSVCSKPLQLTR